MLVAQDKCGPGRPNLWWWWWWWGGWCAGPLGCCVDVVVWCLQAAAARCVVGSGCDGKRQRARPAWGRCDSGCVGCRGLCAGETFGCELLRGVLGAEVDVAPLMELLTAAVFHTLFELWMQLLSEPCWSERSAAC